MSNPFITYGPDGKPVFIGKEDSHIPQSQISEGSKSECPVCHGMFDYLVGEDTPDGGRIGCEKCWKPGTGRVVNNDPPVEDLGL